MFKLARQLSFFEMMQIGSVKQKADCGVNVLIMPVESAL